MRLDRVGVPLLEALPRTRDRNDNGAGKSSEVDLAAISHTISIVLCNCGRK